MANLPYCKVYLILKLFQISGIVGTSASSCYHCHRTLMFTISRCVRPTAYSLWKDFKPFYGRGFVPPSLVFVGFTGISVTPMNLSEEETCDKLTKRLGEISEKEKVFIQVADVTLRMFPVSYKIALPLRMF